MSILKSTTATIIAEQISRFSNYPDTVVINGVKYITKNSNGLPIAQTQDGLVNFWRWFSGSKIIDKYGRPLVCYHGTNTNFSSFKRGVNYFTPRQDYGHVQNSSIELRVYLNIKSPEFVDRVGMIEHLSQDTVSSIISSGYDGIVYANRHDLTKGVTGWGDDKPQIVTFSPTQVKSAIGNNGMYNSDKSVFTETIGM